MNAQFDDLLSKSAGGFDDDFKVSLLGLLTESTARAQATIDGGILGAIPSTTLPTPQVPNPTPEVPPNPTPEVPPNPTPVNNVTILPVVAESVPQASFPLPAPILIPMPPADARPQAETKKRKAEGTAKKSTTKRTKKEVFKGPVLTVWHLSHA